MINDAVVPVPPHSSRSFAPWFFGVLGTVAIFLVVYLAVINGKTAVIHRGDMDPITVQVADSPIARIRGLSGKKLSEMSDSGMLFVYGDKAERTFWMKGMKFNLDFLWIREGKVVKIEKDVPYPPHGVAPEEVSSAPLLVDMVLELPAGMVDEMGLVVGHQLTIDL